ncbi:MAG: TIR domain-containing protein [Proteobacteria bacterium]|nr:TIR domain-containing protein [Pseudomonadota bacterium]
MSELALRLIEENKKTRATFLDLGNCGLTEVPEEIGELVWLEELSFTRERTDWYNRAWISTKTQNTGSANNIATIPAFFSSLKSLKRLWLNRSFELVDLSPLAGLKALQLLNIGNTQIYDLTPITGLAHLQVLSIRNTQVSNLTPLIKLINLQVLNLWKTQVSDLIPLAELTSLQWLNITTTQVDDLTPLSRLVNLRKLYAYETLVSDLAPLARLSNLQTLDISKTKVSDLSPLLLLIEKGISVKFSSEFNEGNGIYAKECPLVNPPIETVQQGNEAILRYFAEKQISSTIKVREAKLLLVGQGKAGKTTLRKKLQDPKAELPAPGDTTRGIEITRLDETMPQTGEPLRINVWDFGGQDIQHYAHQFFLTGNSLYALVTNERIQDSVHLPYWLNIIEMLGKKSPVLLIQNKDGGHCQALREEAAIRTRFGNVHNRVFQTDLSQAATENEFADLRKEIVHQASLLPHVERDYLTSFVELRGKLEEEADRETHYLPWEDYLELMPELSEDLLRDYANALTFLGVCQYFPNDALLSQFVFLRPKWIIDALFALLLHPSLEAKRGHFAENDTFKIWEGAEYRSMHTLLVRMMEEFELCYRVEGGNHTYILPQRLPSESKTYGWNETGDTPVQYRYKFMPKGILTRLICRLHDRIETDPERGQQVWCDAVIFTLPDGKGRVFAREVYSENTIELRASGDKRAEMLNEVIRKMDDINRDAKYDNLQVEKLVPCPCETCQTGEKKHFFDFQLLVDLLEEGETEERCHVSRRKQNINEILRFSGVEYRLRHGFRIDGSAGAPQSAFPRGSVGTRTALRIFISYSHAQRDYFPIFKSDFIQYARIPGLDIEVFGDDAIPIGTAWDELLQTKVADCDAMILLVSQEFMNSNYIKENEFGAALERLKSGRSLLIAPIYFAPCNFGTDDELARLQFFKPHGDGFGEAQKGNRFSYIDLVKFRETDGQPISNANRAHYMMELMKKLGPELRKLA